MLRSAAALESELRRKRADMEDNKMDLRELAAKPDREICRPKNIGEKARKPFRVHLFASSPEFVGEFRLWQGAEPVI
jgi:hypothetical protein